MELGDIATINGIEINLFKRKFLHSFLLKQGEISSWLRQQMSYRTITSSIHTMAV